MNKKTEKNGQNGGNYNPNGVSVAQGIDEGNDKKVLTKSETSAIIDAEKEANKKLLLIGNEIVFKHLLVKQLVVECLKTHKREHDDQLALSLYTRFMKELE